MHGFDYQKNVQRGPTGVLGSGQNSLNCDIFFSLSLSFCSNSVSVITLIPVFQKCTHFLPSLFSHCVSLQWLLLGKGFVVKFVDAKQLKMMFRWRPSSSICEYSSELGFEKFYFFNWVYCSLCLRPESRPIDQLTNSYLFGRLVSIPCFVQHIC